MTEPYTYREKDISDEARCILNFHGVVYEILFEGDVDMVLPGSLIHVENLVFLLNLAYSRGLKPE